MKLQRKHIKTIDVLLACVNFHHLDLPLTDSISPWEQLMLRLYMPEKLVYSAMERDYDKGYLEYGVSLRTSWLTDKGKQYLKENYEDYKTIQKNFINNLKNSIL